MSCYSYGKKGEEELFYVLVKCDNENVFKVHSRCKGEAMKIVYDFLNENQLIDFGNSKDNILFGVVKDPKDFDKEVIKYFENTNLLPIEDEDFEDGNEDIDDTENCDSCEYYCPTCGRCTYDE